VLYLIREKGLSVDAVEELLYRRSGLYGVSAVSDDMREQTAQVLEMLSKALEAGGADVSDVVRVRLLTTDAGEYLHRCHELTVDWYGEHKPASTLHEVAGLAADELEIEIEATAIVDE
jgi:enamine deaminase RidA (YjgF/YER057c/UK114 family)